MAGYFTSKVAIITGASSGIGKALSGLLAAEGAKVVISARSEDKLEALKKQLQEFQTDILVVPADVSKEEDCRRLIEASVDTFGRIDLLINNAGISMRALFSELDLSVFHQLMNTNFWGTVYCTHYAIPHLIRSKGSLAGVSSIAGFRGLPARSAYSSSKFAMQGFLESLRTELIPHDVKVLIACPGFTASNIRNTALGADGKPQKESPRDEASMMTAEEVARHILRAIRKKKKVLVLTRQGKLTVFLNKWFPSLMDKLVFNHLAKEKDSPLKKKQA